MAPDPTESGDFVGTPGACRPLVISDPLYVTTFYLVGGLLLATALAVVTLNNMLHAGLALAATFGLTGALYLLLNAELLFGLQLLAGAGGIALLMAFVARATPHASARSALSGRLRLLAGAGTALAFVALMLVLAGAGWAESSWPGLGATTRELAHQLVRRYAAPFGTGALLLLASLVGATLLSRQEELPGPAVAGPGRRRRQGGGSRSGS
jgi:NADH:ubiquinone oxidoreductase subunit 6 (subunit J)